MYAVKLLNLAKIFTCIAVSRLRRNRPYQEHLQKLGRGLQFQLVGLPYTLCTTPSNHLQHRR